ncbi:MAG: hypothetical protein RLZZ210_1430 [Pseudomonadota bacterium]|jgi:outer membrane protein
MNLNLKKISALCVIAISYACTSINVNAQNAQSLKIGVIDADKIMQDAKISKLAQEKIQKEVSRREQELKAISSKGQGLLDKFQKEAAKLSDSDKEKRKQELDAIDENFKSKQFQYQEEIAKIKNEELANVVSNTNAVIKTVAAQEKFDLILQDAIYVAPSMDITDKVLKILNQ